MYIIKKENFSDAKNLYIKNYLWIDNGYNPNVRVKLIYDEIGFLIKFMVYETNPQAEYCEHFSPVNNDSCVEWFVNFQPETNEGYFNFETNSKGIMNVCFRKSRNEKIGFLSLEDIKSFNIDTVIYDDHWEIQYKIPFEFIKKFIPDFYMGNGKIIKANFYKCGDKTFAEHYACWNMIECDSPDFHRPEYFGELKVE